MIKKHFEDKAIRKLLKQLAPALRQRYGSEPPYTYGQVVATIAELKLNKKYSDYALFVYCSAEEYKKYGLHLEEVKRYEGHKNRSSIGQGGCGGSLPSEGSCGGGD